MCDLKSLFLIVFIYIVCAVAAAYLNYWFYSMTPEDRLAVSIWTIGATAVGMVAWWCAVRLTKPRKEKSGEYV